MRASLGNFRKNHQSLSEISEKQESVFVKIQNDSEFVQSQQLSVNDREDKEDIFGPDTIEKLEQCRDNFSEFIHCIGDMADKRIPEPFFRHMNRKPKTIRNNNSNDVKQLLQSRVSKMIKSKKMKKNWTSQDVTILCWITGKYCQVHGLKQTQFGINKQQWIEIAKLMPGSNAETCMFKWLSLSKSSNERWREKQEEILLKLVQKYTINSENDRKHLQWNSIAKKLFEFYGNNRKIFRSSKQCRQRWNCFLNPDIKKGVWKKEQDIKLVRLIKEYKGLKKWSKFAIHFGGRTQNALKNRFHLLMQKEKRKAHSENFDTMQMDLLDIFIAREQKKDVIKVEHFGENLHQQSQQIPLSLTPERKEKANTEKNQLFETGMIKKEQHKLKQNFYAQGNAQNQVIYPILTKKEEML